MFNFINIVQVIRAQQEQGMARGIHHQKLECLVAPTPVNCYPAGLVLERHPVDETVYFLGTAEGCVNSCCTMYSDRPLDTMRAHEGPVYAVAFSPFCAKVFLTCGADWCVRIWVESIMEPLITFPVSAMNAVNNAVWSPMHSTIIVGVSGSAIYLWDLRCKTTDPAAIIEDPDGQLLTVVKFTADGRNLMVGDIRGHVKIYSLHDFPLVPLLKERALVDALEKALVSQPKLLERVQAIGSPF